jgi:hypothetical protein
MHPGMQPGMMGIQGPVAAGPVAGGANAGGAFQVAGSPAAPDGAEGGSQVWKVFAVLLVLGGTACALLVAVIIAIVAFNQGAGSADTRPPTAGAPVAAAPAAPPPVLDTASNVAAAAPATPSRPPSSGARGSGGASGGGSGKPSGGSSSSSSSSKPAAPAAPTTPAGSVVVTVVGSTHSGLRLQCDSPSHTDEALVGAAPITFANVPGEECSIKFTGGPPTGAVPVTAGRSYTCTFTSSTQVVCK